MYKKYRFTATEPYKLLRIAPELHHALELVAQDMNCTMQEVTFRLLIQGLAWYLIDVKSKTGEAKTAEWAKDPGAERNQSKRILPRRLPQPYRRSSHPVNMDAQARAKPIPDGYVPGDL